METRVRLGPLPRRRGLRPPRCQVSTALDERQQAGVEQLRVMMQITALLVECLASSAPSTDTMGVAYENTSRAIHALAENVRHVATLSKV